MWGSFRFWLSGEELLPCQTADDGPEELPDVTSLFSRLQVLMKLRALVSSKAGHHGPLLHVKTCLRPSVWMMWDVTVKSQLRSGACTCRYRCSKENRSVRSFTWQQSSFLSFFVWKHFLYKCVCYIIEIVFIESTGFFWKVLQKPFLQFEPECSMVAICARLPFSRFDFSCLTWSWRTQD